MRVSAALAAVLLLLPVQVSSVRRTTLFSPGESVAAKAAEPKEFIYEQEEPLNRGQPQLDLHTSGEKVSLDRAAAGREEAIPLQRKALAEVSATTGPAFHQEDLEDGAPLPALGQDADGVAKSLSEVSAVIWAEAVARALEVKQEASLRVKDGSILRPDNLILVLFFVLSGISSFKIYMQSGAANAEQSARARAQRDALQGTYVTAVAEVEGILLGMSESSAYLAEWNFEEKRRGFEKIMVRLRDRPNRFVGDEQTANALLKPFREFLGQWLLVFQQCSIDPVEKPKVMVTNKELNKASSFVDVVGLVADRLGKHHVGFIQAWIQKVRKIDYSLNPEEAQDKFWVEFSATNIGWGMTSTGKSESGRADLEDTDEDVVVSDSDHEAHGAKKANVSLSNYPLQCRFRNLRVTILSQTHSLLLLSFFIGIPVFLLQFLLGNFAQAFLVLVAQGLLGTLLLFIQQLDEVSRLQQEIMQLENLSKEVSTHHEQLSDFYGKLSKLGKLWRYRTLPCLEHFEMLNNQMADLPGPQKVAYLKDISRAWLAINDGLGDLDMWMGEQALDEDYLKLACKQLNDATEFIDRNPHDASSGTLAVQRVGNMFGFLVVRVLACFKLASKAKLGQMSNPYVVITKGRKGKDQWQTKTVQGSLNPVFGEEFFMPVAWTDMMVELHVWDDQIGEDPSLGLIEVNYREFEHGAWHRKRTKLMSAKNGKTKDSEIMYEIFFASEVRQLSLLAPEGGERVATASSSRRP